MAISSKRYCLIAQDNSKSNLQVVNLELSDYPMSCYKLEGIDLYTTQFSSEKELLEDLYRNKLISHLNVHLFIAFESPITGKVEKYNVLYDNHQLYDSYQKLIIQDIRKLASHRLKRNLRDRSAQNIMTFFCRQVFYDENYCNMIDAGFSHIHPALLQFVESKAYCVSFQDIEQFAAEQHQTSYAMFRNIVEFSVNYGCCRLSEFLIDVEARDDVVNSTALANLLAQVYECRQLPGQQVLPGWCSLHSECSGGNSSRFLVSEIPVDSNIQMSDKRNYVMSTLKLLPPNCFEKTGDKSAKFASDKFSLSDDQKYKLENYLDSSCRHLFYLYTENKYGKQKTQKGENVASEVNELGQVTGSCKSRINKYLFRHDEALNRAYAWCKVFNETMGNNIPLPKGKKSRRSGAYVKRYRNSRGS